MDVGTTPMRTEGMGRPLGDAILMKTALEGKDFQTARREAVAEAEARSSEGAPASPRREVETYRGASAEAVTIEALQVTAVDLELRTTEGTWSIQATRVEAQRVLLQGRSAPSGARPPQDPLVVDLDGRGPETTGQPGARPFDLAGDGDVRPTSFVKGDTVFLALDRNGNGYIDDGRELFGDQHGAADGYAELARFDENGDRWIDAQDRVYGDLRLLFGDGRQSTLAEVGILALQVEGQATSDRTTGGDEIFKRAAVQMRDGRTLTSYALNVQRFEVQA